MHAYVCFSTSQTLLGQEIAPLNGLCALYLSCSIVSHCVSCTNAKKSRKQFSSTIGIRVRPQALDPPWKNALRIAIRSIQPEICPILSTGLWEATGAQIEPTYTILEQKTGQRSPHIAQMDSAHQHGPQTPTACVSGLPDPIF